MLKSNRTVRWLAAGLSAIAGYVDALGFLALGGFFVSFMSGNSTRLSVGLAQHSENAAVAGLLIATFVIGVILGSLVGRFSPRRRRSTVLAFVALMLAVAATLDAAGVRRFAVGGMVLAMGAENAVFERDGDVAIGLTYMTGTLVKMGLGISKAIQGGDILGWAPYFILWTGLLLGAVAGGSIYPVMGLQALWIAAAAAGLLSIVIMRLGVDRAD
jgi:uncharacterized membrane protein YoaK (UPF0700 family)